MDAAIVMLLSLGANSTLSPSEFGMALWVTIIFVAAGAESQPASPDMVGDVIDNTNPFESYGLGFY